VLITSKVCKFILAVLLLASCAAADGPVRGIVVDRSTDCLWLGLPGAVPPGTSFAVRLVPSDTAIAWARVTDCTPDSPFVAKARFKLVDPKGFIPIGAYVEECPSDKVPELDKPGGYKNVGMEPSGVNPLTFTANAFFPTDNSLARDTEDIWPAFFLGYRLSSSDKVTTTIEVGFTHQKGSFTVMGVPESRDFRVFPVTFGAKIWTQPRAMCRGGWFAKLGAGAYAIRDKLTVSGASTTDNFVTFGWLAGLGYESGGGSLAQIYYTDTSRSGFRGIVAGVGARF